MDLSTDTNQQSHPCYFGHLAVELRLPLQLSFTMLGGADFLLDGQTHYESSTTMEFSDLG